MTLARLKPLTALELLLDRLKNWELSLPKVTSEDTMLPSMLRWARPMPWLLVSLVVPTTSAVYRLTATVVSAVGVLTPPVPRAVLCREVTALHRQLWMVALAVPVQVPCNVVSVAPSTGAAECLTIRWSRAAQLLQALTDMSPALNAIPLNRKVPFLAVRPVMVAALASIMPHLTATFPVGNALRARTPTIPWCTLTRCKLLVT